LNYLFGLKDKLLKRPERRETCFIKKYNAIYFPIHKVANTSLKKLFYELNYDKRINTSNMRKIHKTSNFPKLPEGALFSKKYFKFAFVRNPYDRIVSFYVSSTKRSAGKTNEGFYKGVHRGLLELSKEFYSGISFKEFVKLISKLPDEVANEHFKSQNIFLMRKGRLIPDFVGKIENLKKDLEIIYLKLKIKKRNFLGFWSKTK